MIDKAWIVVFWFLFFSFLLCLKEDATGIYVYIQTYIYIYICIMDVLKSLVVAVLPIGVFGDVLC